MYNKLKLIVFIKNNVKFLYFTKVIVIYLEHLNIFLKGQHPWFNFFQFLKETTMISNQIRQ